MNGMNGMNGEQIKAIIEKVLGGGPHLVAQHDQCDMDLNAAIRIVREDLDNGWSRSFVADQTLTALRNTEPEHLLNALPCLYAHALVRLAELAEPERKVAIVVINQ